MPDNPEILKECKVGDDTLASTMKIEYLPPSCFKTQHEVKALRREKYRKEMIIQAQEELNKELEASKEENEYCTTYDRLFQIPGFKVADKPPENKEMHLKYPLYKSIPITIYTQRIDSATKEIARVTGMTSIKDPLNPFKKNFTFSKPLDEKLDD